MARIAAHLPTNRRSGRLVLRHSRLRRFAREVLKLSYPPCTGGSMHFRHATGALLILVASVLPGLGQSRPTPTRATYGIAGSVRDDSDQHSMESIRVDLKQSTGTPINTTFTRGNGEFEFYGIPNGDYIIEIIARDYEPYRETVTIENSVRRGLVIFLSRPMAVVSGTSNGSIS